MTHTSLRSIAWLVKNGLTLSEVDQMDESEILAWGVAFGETHGGEWDWTNMHWRDRKR